MDTSWIVGLVLGLAGAVGGWLHVRLKPRDAERAELLSRIAEGAAALVVSLYPAADWAALLAAVVKLLSQAGVTRNREALERAAAFALTRLGKNPGARPG